MRFFPSLFFSLLSIFFSHCAFASYPQILEAENLINNGFPNEALSKLSSIINSDTISQNELIQALEMSGLAAINAGDFSDADTFFARARTEGSKDADLFLGRLAFLRFDFASAKKYLTQYAKSKHKSADYTNLLSQFNRQLSASENALKRVEQLTIIDKFNVPRKNFINAYKIPISCGLILSSTNDDVDNSFLSSVSYLNEARDLKLWAESDTTGHFNIAEASLLTDNTWQRPDFLPRELTMDGNAAFPFLMPDGTTLYYASDGDGSMGGLDIFVASRDAASGEWLRPQNLGMPINSPANDLMMAVDEENGLGWWASDREMIDDQFTIYVYMLPEMRRNINPESSDIIPMARIDSIELSQQYAIQSATLPDEDDEDENPLLGDDNTDSLSNASKPNPLADIEDATQRLKTLRETTFDTRVHEFSLPMGNGTYYHFFSDFKSYKAANLMRDYIRMLDSVNKAAEELDNMRRQYYKSPSSNLATKIKNGEEKLNFAQAKLQSLLSSVYKEELNF